MFQFLRYSSHTYIFSMRCNYITSYGFPHSEIPGSKVAYHLPETYRRLLRPSSAFDVKASTIYPYLILMFIIYLNSFFFLTLQFIFNCQKTNLMEFIVPLFYNLWISLVTVVTSYKTKKQSKNHSPEWFLAYKSTKIR